MYVASVQELENKFLPKSSEQVLVLVGEDTSREEMQSMFHYFQKHQIPCAGGVFPQVIHQHRHYTRGFVVIRLNETLYCNIFPLEASLSVHLPIYDVPDLFALVLVDGLSSDIKSFLGRLFIHYADAIPYLGGGAGSLDLVQKPCLFLNGTLYKNHGLVLLVKGQLKQTVRHGWEILEGPFLVTNSEKNILQEINWQNSYAFYREIVEEYADQTMTSQHFFHQAKAFPFGIARTETTLPENLVVRDPLRITEDRHIVCVSDIPKKALLYILHGSMEMLLKSTAAYDKSRRPGNALVFDCISRVLLLGEHIDEELRNIQGHPENCLNGAMTIGEIASTQQGYLEFLNKTIVHGEY